MQTVMKKMMKIPPIKSQRAMELAYTVELNKIGSLMLAEIRKELLPYLKNNEQTYRSDSLGDDIGKIFNGFSAKFTGSLSGSLAESIANKFVAKVDLWNKKKFNKSIERASGVDLGNIVATEGLSDFLSLSSQKNASLIKSLPEKFFSDIEVIVNNGLVNGTKYNEIAKQIMSKTGASGKLASRIKTIARNETQTLNAQLTVRRSKSLGIKRGVYITAGDVSVRACHKELNGVEFDLNKGAWSKICQKYIIPGVTDINCRCSYSPIIEV